MARLLIMQSHIDRIIDSVLIVTPCYAAGDNRDLTPNTEYFLICHNK